MVAIRHTCCIFKEPRQPIEKHHINGKTTDNIWNNLAVLCPESCRQKRGVVECSAKTFVAPKRGRYVLLLVNWGDEPTTVSIDEFVWDAE